MSRFDGCPPSCGLPPDIAEAILDGRQPGDDPGRADEAVCGGVGRTSRNPFPVVVGLSPGPDPAIPTATAAIADLATLVNTGMPEWGIRHPPSRRKDARYNLGQLIDTARAESVAVVKCGRAVVVVLALKGYERLESLGAASPAKPK